MLCAASMCNLSNLVYDKKIKKLSMGALQRVNENIVSLDRKELSQSYSKNLQTRRLNLLLIAGWLTDQLN